MDIKCEVHGCNKQREHNRRHYCQMHRKRLERHNNLHTVKKRGRKKKEKQ